MKADIDKEGMLVVYPESSVEAYALVKWYQDWQDQKVCFSIDANDDKYEVMAYESMGSPDK